MALRFLLLTLMLSYIWVWLFRKIVVERPLYIYITTSDARMHTIHISTTASELPPYIQNPFVTLWFGTFTYLVADMWRVWIRAIFRINPAFDDDDDLW